MHFWRIHAKVSRRLWSDLPMSQRNIIAADAEHTTELFKWFDAKVNTDATRLYEDSSYFANQEDTFRYSGREPFAMAA